MQSDETCPMCGGPEPCRECYEYALDAVGAPIGLGKEQEMNLTGLDLGAWLTKSGAVVLVTDYECATQIFTGYAVHPMREVRYGKDGRLVSCCFLQGELRTVEHEQKLHECLHLERKLGDVDAVITVNQAEWEKSYADFAPARRQDSAGAGIYDEVPPLVNTYADRTLNASKLLKDAVDEAKMVFDTATSAELEVVPAPLREWRVLTPSGCWETVVATNVEYLGGGVVEVYDSRRQLALFVNPQAVIAGSEVDTKPAVPAVTVEMLYPLADVLDHLYRLIVHGPSYRPQVDAVAACVERFNNLMKTVRGE